MEIWKIDKEITRQLFLAIRFELYTNWLRISLFIKLLAAVQQLANSVRIQ